MPHRPISHVIENKTFVTVPAGTSVVKVARLMKERHATAVLVVRHSKLSGICTERDIVLGVVAEGKSPEHISVEKIMTANPQTIHPNKPFGHALHIMYEGGFRHLPVVDTHGSPVGLLSARDALKIDAAEFGDELVRREEIAIIL